MPAPYPRSPGLKTEKLFHFTNTKRLIKTAIASLKERLRKLTADLGEAKKAVTVFYAVGTLGLLLPFSFPLFVKLVPFALLLSFLLLFFFHTGPFGLREFVVFATVYTVSFLAEVAGVATGELFGSYHYGSALGLKLLETPLIIGLNWLFLVYATAGLAGRLKVHPLLRIITGSLAMVAYDFFLEIAAPSLDMWHWEGGSAPFRNYLTWFGFSLLFHALVRFSRVNTLNPLSSVLFAAQFLFFVVLSLFIP